MVRSAIQSGAPSALASILYPENYVPLAVAYGVSLVLWGLALLVDAATNALGLYAAFHPAVELWAGLALAVGALQLVLLRPALRRFLFWSSLASTFLWAWISCGFFLSMGHVSTAQAMYTPASVAAAWLALRTAPITW